jgi:radical SAM superfamily enzyme YgiQ (UPF0313 family)
VPLPGKGQTGFTPTDAVLISLQVDLDTIGLKSLHAALLEAGFSSKLLYLPGLQPPDLSVMDPVAAFLRRTRPQFIGISLMSHEYTAAVSLTGYIRRAGIDIPIVWGGIHPTIVPEMCLDHADYICVGEGEAAVVEFLTALKQGRDTNAIVGFRSKHQGPVTGIRPAPLIGDLDRLPYIGHIPRDSFILRGNRIICLNKSIFKSYARWKGTVYSFMASRGCPFSCSYCCNEYLSRMYETRTIRRRSVASIINELETAVRQNPDIVYINFQDDCFLACPDDYLAAFCRAYQARIRRPFIVRCIPSFVSEDRLKQLKAAGLSWISMGLQSGSDHVLTDIYHRRSLAKDFLKAATLIRKVNVAAYYDVILDNPFETDVDRLDTVAVLAAVPRPFFLQLFSLVLFPGTSLYSRMLNERGQCPTEYLVKNYHDYQKTDLNRLIRISGYLPVTMVRYLTAAYARYGSTPAFRLRLRLAGLISAFWLEPLTYFRVVKKSRQENIVRTLQVLPAFLRIGISRYIKQFEGPTVRRIERLIRDHSTGES